MTFFYSDIFFKILTAMG